MRNHDQTRSLKRLSDGDEKIPEPEPGQRVLPSFHIAGVVARVGGIVVGTVVRGRGRLQIIKFIQKIIT